MGGWGVGAKQGKEGRLEGSLPLRVVTSVRTVLDYIRGTEHRPKSWMEPFPLLDGTPARKGELILLIVSPELKPVAGTKLKSDLPTILFANSIPFALFVPLCLCLAGN